MSVELTLQTKLTSVETITTNVPAAAESDKTVTHNGFDTTASLNGSSTPPVDTCAYFEKDLVAGAGSIDLTALTGTNGAAISLNGKKPIAIKFKAKSGNANPITIAKGAANGFDGLGSAFSITLKPKQEVTFYADTNGNAVSGTNKIFDLTGTGTQGLQVSIVAGA